MITVISYFRIILDRVSFNEHDDRRFGDSIVENIRMVNKTFFWLLKIRSIHLEFLDWNYVDDFI